MVMHELVDRQTCHGVVVDASMGLDTLCTGTERMRLSALVLTSLLISGSVLIDPAQDCEKL